MSSDMFHKLYLFIYFFFLILTSLGCTYHILSIKKLLQNYSSIVVTKNNVVVLQNYSSVVVLR